MLESSLVNEVLPTGSLEPLPAVHAKPISLCQESGSQPCLKIKQQQQLVLKPIVAFS